MTNQIMPNTTAVLTACALLISATMLQPAQTQAQVTPGTTPNPLQTQETLPLVNLAVTPPTAYLHVKPGSQATHTVTLENTGTTQLTITPQVVDFSADGFSGVPILSEVTTFPYLRLAGGGSDLESSLQPVTIPAGKKAQLTLLIDAPATATEKEWPLTILFHSQSSRPISIAHSGSSITGAVGSNLVVLISHRDELPQQLEIENLTAPRVFDSFGTLRFTPVLKNPQFSAIAASGSAVIRNWRGTPIANFALHPDSVLGFSTRAAQAGLLTPGGELTSGPLEHDQPIFLGPYTIELSLVDSTGSPYLVRRHLAIALPLLLLLGVGAVSAVGVGYWVLRKKSTHYF